MPKIDLRHHLRMLIAACRLFSPSLRRTPHRRSFRAKPAEPAEIDRVPCAAGYVFRWEADPDAQPVHARP